MPDTSAVEFYPGCCCCCCCRSHLLGTRPLSTFFSFLFVFIQRLCQECVLFGCCRFLHTPWQVKGLEGCVPSLPALRTKHSFSHAAPLPDCQHSRGKTAKAFIFFSSIKWLFWVKLKKPPMFRGSPLCHEYDSAALWCSCENINK